MKDLTLRQPGRLDVCIHWTPLDAEITVPEAGKSLLVYSQDFRAVSDWFAQAAAEYEGTAAESSDKCREG